MGPKSNDSVLIRDRKEENTHTHTHGHVKTEAEAVGMLSQTKEFQELTKAGQGKGILFPRAFRGNTVMCHLDFKLLGSRTEME